MGFDEERIVKPADMATLDDLECVICTGILEDPRITPCCDKIFCKSCLARSFRALPAGAARRRCPHCRTSIRAPLRRAHRGIRAVLGRLFIRCSFAPACQVEPMPLAAVREHESQCEHNPEREDHDCEQEAARQRQLSRLFGQIQTQMAEVHSSMQQMLHLTESLLEGAHQEIIESDSE